jgi:tRNA pseudouridine55 synthase
VEELLQKRKKMSTNKLPFNNAEKLLEGQVLVFDKPLTWTSFDVVNKVRGTIRGEFNIKKIKVGHAGTLDPLATGVLVICTGRKTKTIDLLQAEKKTYTGVIRLGATTPSYDAETDVDSWGDASEILSLNLAQVSKTADTFLGSIEQMPPQYSAKKVDGVTAYKAARQGKTVALKHKTVTIDKFDIESFTKSEVSGHKVVDVKFTVECSKGTYIRSMAHDLGAALNVGGTLVELRRTKSGNFHVEEACNLEEFISSVKSLAPTRD